MAGSPIVLLRLFLIVFSVCAAAETRAVDANERVAQKTWCVAKPSSDDRALRNNIDYACSHVDCGAFTREGSACSSPNSLINHASVAMNLYYRASGANKWNCYFTNSALITTTDPSYDGCVYA